MLGVYSKVINGYLGGDMKTENITLEDLGVKFEDVAHLNIRGSDYALCGIPMIELLGFRFPRGKSGKLLCIKCASLEK